MEARPAILPPTPDLGKGLPLLHAGGSLLRGEQGIVGWAECSGVLDGGTALAWQAGWYRHHVVVISQADMGSKGQGFDSWQSRARRGVLGKGTSLLSGVQGLV
ncbi:hypothetical protein Bbelb_119900 [Branchiostoma belcheri]|nr:hypothetical protein Bbelb_119900 [Branchiostoma belcheri]